MRKYIEESVSWQCTWCGWEMDYRYIGQSVEHCSNVCRQQHRRLEKHVVRVIAGTTEPDESLLP